MRKQRSDKGKEHKKGAGRPRNPSLSRDGVYLSQKASWERRRKSGVYYLSAEDQQLATEAGERLGIEGRSEIVRASLRHVLECV